MDWICKVKAQEESKVLWFKQMGGYSDNFCMAKRAESQHVIDSEDLDGGPVETKLGVENGDFLSFILISTAGTIHINL